MIPSTGLGITLGNRENEIDNKDPFIVTPPRKHDSAQHTASTTPATPKSRSTPLHKRFLEEVTMSPETTSTPPRTPTRSPKRGQTPKQTLEVGQNGFYFSMEIPEKKITPRRAATPDAKATGRVTPSPEKQKRSEVKVGGRVKDILRKNLFGTSTKHVMRPGNKGSTTEQTSPSKLTKIQSSSIGESESERKPEGTTKEAAIEHLTAPLAVQNSPMLSQSSTDPTSTTTPSTQYHSAMPTNQSQGPGMTPAAPTSTDNAAPTPRLQKCSAASTPSNIGHLMANHSNKGSKIQILPETVGLESMPTPLRKMSERLGLRSPNVVRKSKFDENLGIPPAPTAPEQTLRSPISALDLRDATAVTTESKAAAGEREVKTATATVHRVQSEQRLRQLLPSPITTAFPVVSSRPSTATTPRTSSPSTPSRPGLGIRAKSFGTPSRLRSSMQEDMFKMQESLKRSLGSEAFLPNGSRPSTPMSLSPSMVPAEAGPTIVTQSKGSPKKTTRPVSMVGPPKANEVKTTDTVARSRPIAAERKPRPKSMFGPPTSTGVKSTDTKKDAKPTSEMAAPKAVAISGTSTVPRRRPTTAERKSRPKSMIVGSAKMLETIASQIDSPRERAKLRSAAATPSARQVGPTTSRPGTVASTSRPQTAITKPPVPKPQPAIRNSRPAHPRPTTQPQLVAHAAPSARPRTAPAPLACRPIQAQTISKPVSTRSHPRPLKTPEPEVRDLKKDSGTAQSYTPPGQPTRLPSPVKEVSRTRLVVAPAAPAPTLTTAPKPVREVSSTQEMAPAAAGTVPAQAGPRGVQTPFPKRVFSGIREGDVNVLRTPSKEVQSALDVAIDRKIREDRERIGAGWL